MLQVADLQHQMLALPLHQASFVAGSQILLVAMQCKVSEAERHEQDASI